MIVVNWVECPAKLHAAVFDLVAFNFAFRYLIHKFQEIYKTEFLQGIRGALL